MLVLLKWFVCVLSEWLFVIMCVFMNRFLLLMCVSSLVFCWLCGELLIRWLSSVWLFMLLMECV